MRSLLFVPAVRPDFFPKLPERNADIVAIDLEDSIPAARKAQARQAVQDHAPALIATGQYVVVRLNPVTTEWFADDVAHGLVPGLNGVIVPKLSSAAMVDAAVDALDAAGYHDLTIIAGLETVAGIVNANEITAHPRVTMAFFGAEDYVADLGGQRTPSNEEVAVPRALAAIAARLAEIPILDQVVTDFTNDERFARECAESRALGYTGKLCIHPLQVAVANRCFVPSADEIDHARRLLAAYDEASKKGISAIVFEGKMVDEPLAAQARNLISQSSGWENT